MRGDRMIKRVIASGNAGGVYVPKKWINRYVVVTLFRTKEYVLDVFRPYDDCILGIYLHGSHARGDFCPDSDINVFVIADRGIPYQRKPGLNAEIVLLGDLEKYAESCPVDYYLMANEAVALKDAGIFEMISKYVLNDARIKKFCGDVELSMKLSERLASEGDYAAAVYSLIYRLRGLYVVQSRASKCSHKGFEEFLRGRGISEDDYRRLYGVYRAERDDRAVSYYPSAEDVERLSRIAEKTLKEVRSIYPKAV